MFDRDAAVAEWRARLARTGQLWATDLDELEAHVRDHIDALEEVGFAADKAFRIALESLGDAAALGDEFAKVNRLLAWRAPLFWVAIGTLAILVGSQVVDVFAMAVVRGGAALGVHPQLMVAIVWALGLALPLASLAALFRWAEKRRAPLAWASTPVRRVTLLVVGALVVIGATVGGYVLSTSAAPSGVYDVAWYARYDTRWVLHVAAPISIAAYTLGLRLGAPRDAKAPSFFLGLGFLAAFGADELATITRCASLAGGGAIDVGVPTMRALAWAAGLATPVLAVMCGAAWLWRRSPPPSEFLSGRGFVVAAMSLVALLIARPLATVPLVVRAASTLGAGVMAEGFSADFQARLVAATALVVASGALALRLRTAARRPS